jgi:hypothetical protein
VTASIKLTALGGTPNTGTDTVGAGTNCLTIVDNYTSNVLFKFTPTYASSNNVTTIENINIDPESTSTGLYSPLSFAGTCTASGCPLIRVDNMVFGEALQWNENNNSSNADTMIRTDNVFGVLDHNTVPSGTTTLVFANISHSAYLGVGSYGDNSWAQPDSFGGPNNLFLENNHIWTAASVTDQEFAAVGGAIGGGRMVGRYNTIEAGAGFFVAFTGHGMDTDGRPRSFRHIEAYDNTINCTGGSCGAGAAGFRGGTGIVYNNTLNANYPVTGGFYNNIAGIAVYRTVYNGPAWGPCGGLKSLAPFDMNDNSAIYSGNTASGSSGLTMYDTSKSFSGLLPTGAPYSVYDVTKNFVAEIASFTSTSITIRANIPEQANSFSVGDSYQIIRSKVCADQAGRGAGNYISGTTPSPASALSEALDPIYEWNDRASNLNHGNVSTDTARTIANRDWYTDNSNGSPVAQTSPTSPFDGSGSGGNGVGWGTLARRPTTCTVQVGYFATDTNTLYECLSPNVWTPSYTPYTYPHPLTSSDSPVAPPTGLAAQVQ